MWASISTLSSDPNVKLVVRAREKSSGPGVEAGAVIGAECEREAVARPVSNTVHLDSPPPDPPFPSQPGSSQHSHRDVVVPATPEHTDESEVEDSDAEGDSASKRRLQMKVDEGSAVRFVISETLLPLADPQALSDTSPERVLTTVSLFPRPPPLAFPLPLLWFRSQAPSPCPDRCIGSSTITKNPFPSSSPTCTSARAAFAST
jgi:hypothetical protein